MQLLKPKTMSVADTMLGSKRNRTTAILAVTAAVAALAAFGILGRPIFADSNNSTQAPEVMKVLNGTNFAMFKAKMPAINGTVDIRNILRDSTKVDFVAAASAAKGAVGSGTVLGGALGIVQGYLVYNFEVMDSGNKVHNVMVDAGSGSVLYTSDGFDMGPNVPSIVGSDSPQVFAGMPGMIGIGGVQVKAIG